jgi:hypothetical protein
LPDWLGHDGRGFVQFAVQGSWSLVLSRMAIA